MARYGGRDAASSSLRRSSTRPRNLASANVGTLTSTTSNAAANSCLILAITAGRGNARDEVGLAAIDLQRPHVVLCQISDCQTYINTLTKIHVFQPVEILMPDTMSERAISRSKLYRSIKDKFQGASVTAIARRHFNAAVGLERIRTHCAKEYANVELFVKAKFYALAATAALLKYVEYIQHVLFAPKSMKIEFQGSQNTTTIDVESAQNLELVAPQGGPPNSSLLAALDRCSTPMGRRLLRASILQPSCDKGIVEKRQACVAELVANGSLFSVIQSIVRRLFGADRLLGLSMQNLQNDSVQNAERNLNYALLLKHTLDIVPALRAALETAESYFFGKVRENLADPRYQLMTEKVLEVIQPEARAVMGFTSSNMQRCFALKVGINEMLDVARQTYCELIDDMKTLVEDLALKYSLSLTLGCSKALGYHIQLEVPRRRNVKVTDLPTEFIEVQKRGNCFYMTTDVLLVLSQHCKDACEELHVMSNVVLNEMLIEIRQCIGCIYQLSADVAELDLVMSLARISSISDYVRPTIGPRLELKGSRHPIMDILGTDTLVPNDVEASVSYNFHTIVGPNMSGKTVYIKQIVLLQIMAQMGCYVPATQAQFRIADRIFCRIYFGDDIECNASTFILEIKEVQYILRTITPRSLVIMDELCRCTTVGEGTSIAWATCERLLLTSAFTFFTTHFLYLTRLTELYPNVTNHYLETTLTEGAREVRLTYTHKLMEGVALVENYGIALAESSSLPDCIVTLARQYASKIVENTKPVEQNQRVPTSWKRKCYEHISKMYRQLEDDRFSHEQILQLVVKLQNDYLNHAMDVRKNDPANPNPSLCETTRENHTRKEEITSCSPSTSNIGTMKESEKRKRENSLISDTVVKTPRHEMQSELIRSESHQSTRQNSIPLRRNSNILLRCNSKNVKTSSTLSTWSREITVPSERYLCSEVVPEPNSCNQNRINLTITDIHKAYISDDPSTAKGQESELLIDGYGVNGNKYFSMEPVDTTGTSQSSESTEVAKITARRKEAEIFKIIEGDAFQETEFCNNRLQNEDSVEIIEHKNKSISMCSFIASNDNKDKYKPIFNTYRSNR